MKKLLLSIALFLTIFTQVKSQDTIFVKKDKKVDNILCKITKVTSMNIFYTESKVGKSLPLKEVMSYSKSKSQDPLAIEGQELIIFTSGDTINGTVSAIFGDYSHSRIFRSDGGTSIILNEMIKSTKKGKNEPVLYNTKKLPLGINVGYEPSVKPFELEISKEVKTDNGKNWLIFSGVSLLTSGLIDLISSNMKIKSINDINKVRNLSGISAACRAISGLSIIIGVSIKF